MSNGDAVLDNWEEFDETEVSGTLLEKLKNPSDSSKVTTAATAFSSKTLTTTTSTTTSTSTTKNSTVLAQSINQTTTAPKMKLLQRPSANVTQDTAAPVAAAENAATKPSPLDDMADAFQPVLMVLHKNDTSEYESANYTPAFNNQTVKILRRPAQHQEQRINADVRPKQPIKTLQQREQEYAEARLRIMGAAKNPEDETISPSTTESSAVTVATTPPTTTATTSSVTATTTPNSMQQTRNTNVLSNSAGPMTAQIKTNVKQSPPAKQQHNSGGAAHLQRANSSPKLPPAQIPYNSPMQHYYHAMPTQHQHLNYYFQSQFQNGPPPPQMAYNNRMPPQHIKNGGNYVQQQPNYHQSQQLHMNHIPPHLQHQQTADQSWSPVVGGSVSSATLRQPPQHLQRQQQHQQQQQLQQLQQQQQQQQNQPYNDTILRLPRGPCPAGTTGFQIRR